ncbi:MAG: RagB/SusD family nutrient uptake outer membrane protein [Bacteroidales bacterium]|nr:RagB/SusD family nutrient uptake outer membrane protein [Bacteroidales bacterium]
MKKIITYLLCAFAAASCSSFLVKEPEDSLAVEDFFKDETQCRLYTNRFYRILPSGAAIFDEGADIIIKSTLAPEIRGARFVSSKDKNWTWDALREINFFLENAWRCDDAAVRAEYCGLAKFFRAFFYFDKLRRFGDVPWYDHTLDPADITLYKERDSRQTVCARVLEDINEAIATLPSEHEDYRVTRWTALALKSRIFLFEGTFRKYHGLPGWEECLDECILACKELIDNGGYSLYTEGETPYRDLFLSKNTISKEVILAQSYGLSMGLTHNANDYFTSTTMGRSGLLKDVVDMYLMKDGSTFTSGEDFDNLDFVAECQNRDPRLAQTIRTPGYTRVGSNSWVAPDMNATLTGYQITKFVGEARYDISNTSENDLPLFRIAEVYLNYAEAKAELGTITQADLDETVCLLRSRVGMPALDLSSANAAPDPYLCDPVTGYRNVSGPNKGIILEIRRERTIELVCEGFRYWDIMRWKEGKRFDRPFVGMYFPGPGTYDLDGNGSVDFCIYLGDAPAVESGVAYSNIADLALTQGMSGNIVRFGNIPRNWREDRDYLYPIPTDDIVLTGGAITQNPNWN